MNFLIDLVMRAGLVNVFHRAFADQHVVAFVIHHHGHAFALKIERNLIHFPAAALHIQIGVRKDRAVQQVAQPRLIVTVHVGVAQHVVAIAVGHIDSLFENDPILRQGARLVRAEDIDRAEVLDRVQPLHDDFLLRHGHRAFGKVHRHNHRQHFRRQPHGHRKGEKERFRPVVLGQADNQKDDRDHDHHEADHEPGEAGDAFVKTRLGPLSR